jgi:anti-repressor protein
MDELRIFESPKFGSVRCFILDGKPWFSAVDVCRAMGTTATNVAFVLRRLNADEWTHHKTMMSNGLRPHALLSESGVMSAVRHSVKPIAPETGEWFQNEVFPALNGEQHTDTVCKPDDTDSDTVRDADSEILPTVGNDELRTFTNSEFGDVRTDVDENGKVLFCGNDVAKALGYTNVPDALKRHCRAIVKRDTPISGKMQGINFIPESDVYRLAFGSKLPSAERFTDWVTEEILPSIRKRGGYILNQDMLSNEELMARAVLLAQQTIADKTAQLQAANETIGVMAPKAAYYDNVLQSDNLLTVTQIAKCYGMTAAQLNTLLKRIGVQYKQGAQWLPYAEYADKDYIRIVTVLDGAGQARQQTKWTQTGRKFIYDELKEMGILPISERGKGEGDA